MLAYEELKGSDDRQIRFRPRRYAASRLFPASSPRVRVRDARFRLQDISLGGLAAVSSHTDNGLPSVGENVPLALHQGGLPIFESTARVCRSEHTVFGTKIAFSFVDQHIEFDKLLTRNAEAQIAARFDRLSSESARAVPLEYRAFCADVLSILKGYRQLLEQNGEIASEFGGALDRFAAFKACEDQMIQQWRKLWLVGNELTAGFASDRELREAAKEYTELVLTPELRLGAIWDRSYAKPMGYPGDFQIMNQVYDWQQVGGDTYEMLMHRIGLDVAECIRTRMEVVATHISATIRQMQGRPARFLSLGSGPAREIETALNERRIDDGPCEFTLIDQEEEALRYAHAKTFPYVQKSKGDVKVSCLHMSFTDILRGGEAFENMPPQDIIYSVGLLDYLTDARCKALVQRLYKALAPSGQLIIGNMNACPDSNYWPMEYITDWSLHYRDHMAMIQWVDGLQGAEAWTETERTGRVRLLFVRKRS